MKKNKSLKRLVSALICIAIIFFVIPAGVYAAEETADTVEVVSLREENVKHFDMGNGTYQAIAYSHPIHEKDENGNWQDIDFSMDLTRQNGKRVYANEAGGTAFAASYRANQPIMTLGEEGSSISMTLVADTPSTWSLFGSSVAAEVTGAEVDIQTVEDAQNADFSNTLLYEEVMPGIDLEYIVDPWCVKENIIVNQPAESYFYRFLLEMDGMYPVMQEDGSILIYSEETNEPEYEIPAPYMYDAEGEESFDVFYNIETTNGDYYLTVFADSNWINAEERVFPVTIDPTYADYQDVTMDTYINGDAANETRGAYTFLYVGENEKAYIYMPTPELPEGALLYGADLSVWYYYFDKVSTGYVDVTAHQVDGMTWSDGTLTWNMAGNYSSTYGLSSTKLGEKIRMYGNIGAYKETPQKADFDITLAVQDWIDNSGTNYGVGSNYGIGLDYDADSSANRSVRLHSTESTASYKPKLTYSYFTAGGGRYYDALIDIYGFSATEANLIMKVYTKVDEVYSNKSGMYRAWVGSRLLGGLYYDDDSNYKKWLQSVLFEEVAGASPASNGKTYFTETLGFTSTEYEDLYDAIVTNHNEAERKGEGDFSHMQISLAGRLAYNLGKNGLLSNITDEETLSYMIGWLGDATILENGKTSFGGDDYISDLDAENIYRLILSGKSMIEASHRYYCSLGSFTRAEIFTGYISYETVVKEIEKYLSDDQEKVMEKYPDTHDFIFSIRDKLNEMGDY